jgi:hypothetical protein
MRRSPLVLAFFVLAACGGGQEMRSALDAVVRCDAESVRLTFDPAESAQVESEGRILAVATFTTRRLSTDCEAGINEPDRWTSATERQGLYRRAAFACRVESDVGIHVHPILNADKNRNDGSVLLVLDGDTIVASAVLKNKGDPNASRIYHAPSSCIAS